MPAGTRTRGRITAQPSSSYPRGFAPRTPPHALSRAAGVGALPPPLKLRWTSRSRLPTVAAPACSAAKVGGSLARSLAAQVSWFVEYLLLDTISPGRLLDAGAGFIDDRSHHRPKVTSLPVDAQLPIGARPLREDRPDVLDLLAAPQLVDDVVDDLEQLDGEIAHRHFAAP